MRCKKTFLSLVFSMSVSLGQPALAIEPVTLAGCALGVAGAACVVKACQSFLKSETFAELRGFSETAAERKQREVQTALQLENFGKRQQLLANTTAKMNAETFGSGIELRLGTRPELFGRIPATKTQSGRQTKRMAKTLGSYVALAHLNNLITLEESSPAFVMEKVAEENPAFDLDPKHWALTVVPHGTDGGNFSSAMQLAMYVHDDQARILLSTESLVYLEPSLDQQWVDYGLLSTRLPDWEIELEQLQQISVRFKISKARNSFLNSRGPFGSFKTEHAVLEVEGAADLEQEMQAYLYLLRKAAAFIKWESLNGNPVFSKAYRTRMQIEQEELLSLEKKARHPRDIY